MKLMRKIAGAVISAAVAFAYVCYPEAKIGCKPLTAGAAESYYALCENMLMYINSYRHQNGLGPVELNLTLSDAASVRAKETVSLFDHYRPNGTKFNTAIDEFNLTYYYALENIAYGYQNPREVMAGWMESSGHRTNILDPNVKYVGVGIYGTYWVQIFTGDMTGNTTKGDVNYDNVITAADAASTLRYYAVKATYDDFGEINDFIVSADYNNDGSVTAIDASMILERYAKGAVS